MQADGNTDQVEIFQGDQAPPSLAASWPSAMEVLLEHPDLHPDARGALARLEQADIDQLWADSQAEVESWPPPMRSKHDVAACFIGWAMARWQQYPDYDELAGRVRLVGQGIGAQILVADTRGRWDTETLEGAADQVLRRIAQQTMRQALGPGVYGRPPYCTAELLHPEHEYPAMDRATVHGWIQDRTARMEIHAGELLRQRMMRDPRSLGALQGAYEAPRLQAKALATVARSPVFGGQLLEMAKTAPMLVRRQLYDGRGTLEDRVAEAKALLQTPFGKRLTRQHDMPLGPVPRFEGNLAREAWLRAVLLEAGSAAENAFTMHGGENVRRVFGHWLSMPGALEVANDPAFVAGPMFVGMRDCESEEFVVFSNTLNDTIAWSECRKGDARARALLAMNFRDLHRLGEAMHQHAQQRAAASPPPTTEKECAAFLSEQAIDGLDLMELRSPEALRQEGVRLKHCVANYWGKSAYGGCRIIAIRKRGVSMATCEIVLRDGAYVIAQLTGPGNGKPPKAAKEAMERVMIEINRGDIIVAKGAIREEEEARRAMRAASLGSRLDPEWLDDRLAPWMGRAPLAIRRSRRMTAAGESS